MKRLSDSDRREKIVRAAKLQASGMTHEQIAAVLGVTVKTVQSWRWKHKDLWIDKQPAGFRGKTGPPPKETFDLRNREASEWTRRQIAAAAQLFQEGKTYDEIGEVLGVARRTVEGWRDNHVDLWKQAVEETGLVRDRITQRVRQGIAKATSLIASGGTMEEAAQGVGIGLEGLREWKRKHPALWAQEEEQSAEAVIALVRKLAGTGAILAGDVGVYIRQAEFADRWVKARGESLFPVTGETTLSSFFDSWYRPVRLVDASPKTLAKFRSCLNRWRLLTGDPPVQAITAQTLAMFRDALAKMPGKDRVCRASPNTVRSNLRQIQAVLDKCGKPGPRNRDAAGLIDEPPWVKPPKPQWSMPKTVAEEHVNAIYAAAFNMDVPKLWPMFKPSAWWRALIVTTWSTGLRRRTLFELEWTFVDWQKRWLAIPGKHLKNGRPTLIPLTDVALEHLQAIRSNRRLIFAWPSNGEMESAIKGFYREWGRLLEFAGISTAERFTLHSLRRTLGTNLWDTCPEAAQLMLGHSEAETTRQHYVRSPEIIARALAHLPVPAAFSQKGGGA